MRAAISERRRCALDVRPSDPHGDPEGVLHWACFADGGTEERMGELANTPGGGGRLHFCPHLCLLLRGGTCVVALWRGLLFVYRSLSVCE